MNRIMRFFLGAAAVYLSFCLVAFPKTGISAGRDAVSVCLGSVIPALFPYLVCSGYISASGLAAVFGRYLSPVMKPLFNLPGSGAVALVLGSVCGYPIGAACAADLFASGQCSKADAEKMLAFCNNSGPLFVMSVVGFGYLESPHLGRILYISHLLSAVLVGIILRTYKAGHCEHQRTLPPDLSQGRKNALRIFGGVIDSSVFTILKICGFVIFFSCLAASLPKTPILPYVHGFLEITGGIRAIAACRLDFGLKMSIISSFIAFSGISVLFQVGAIASQHGLSLKPYVLGKALQGGLSALLTYIMVSRLPETALVFSLAQSEALAAMPHTSLTASLFMLGLSLLVLGLLVVFSKLFLKLRQYIP